MNTCLFIVQRMHAFDSKRRSEESAWVIGVYVVYELNTFISDKLKWVYVSDEEISIENKCLISSLNYQIVLL